MEAGRQGVGDAVLSLHNRGDGTAAQSGHEDAPRHPVLGGHYLVIDELGRGQRGITYRAYDLILQREVAVRSYRCGDVPGETAEGFLREVRAMARLSHPNVVAILNVEVQGDESTVAMEYIPGSSLDEWLQRHRCKWRDVVSLFLAAGRGLEAAHAVGLLHGAFERRKVLVGNDGRVKVADFGLTRPQPQSPTSERVIGVRKPDAFSRYTAPEQHECLEPSAAADQFAFCMALFEALTGRTPCDASDGQPLVALEHQGPPPWPRCTKVPRRIREAVQRGLAPAPEQRWASMSTLLDVLAYDGRKRLFGFASGLAATGTLALSWGLWQRSLDSVCSGAEPAIAAIWNQARGDGIAAAVLATDLPYAEESFAHVRGKLDSYASSWAAMHTEVCRATSVRGEQPAAVMDLKMACLRRAKEDLRAVVDLLMDADHEMVQRLHGMTDSLRRLDLCHDVETLRMETLPPSDAKREAVEALRARLSEALALGKAGRLASAHEELERMAIEAKELEYRPLVAEVLLALGDARREVGARADSLVALREALREGLRTRQRAVAQEAAAALMFGVGFQEALPADAFAFAETAKALIRPGDIDAEAAFHTDVGSLHMMQGFYREAEGELRKAVELRKKGADLVALAAARNNLATVLDNQAKYEEAEAEYRASATAHEQALGQEHPSVAYPRNNLGSMLASLGRHAEAEVEIRAALGIREKTLAPNHPGIASARENLGILLLAAGKPGDAEVELRKAVQLRVETVGPEDSQLVSPLAQLGTALQAQGRHLEALHELQRALAIGVKTLGPDHPFVGMTRGALGQVYIALGRRAEGEQELRTALAVLVPALGPQHPSVVEVERHLPRGR